MKYHFDLPTIPHGKDFARDSFWWRYRSRFTNPLRYGWQVKPSALDWFDREEKAARLENRQFPPAPVFQALARPIPQPWDGKSEKPGRVPRM